jgi:hypothetical protein
MPKSTILINLITWVHHCDKICEKNNLKEETIISAYGFRGLSSRSLATFETRQNIIVLGTCSSRGYSPHDHQETERSEWVQEQDTPFNSKAHPR